jgi:peptidoglycan hydrolase-like protein with peptidoglycan-binding domain
LRRGVKEAIVAVAALPLLIAAGVYIGGRISDGGTGALVPSDPVAAPAGTPSPLVTVKSAAPAPLVTVKPPAPGPRVTAQPPAPAPVVTVKPPAPAPAVVPPAVVPPAVVPPAVVPPAVVPPAVVAPKPIGPAGPGVGPVAPAAPPPGPQAVLGRGSNGNDVRTWQRQMARRTWHIAVDGVFGPQSARVARRFQAEKGLRVDGLVGPRTWDAAWRRPITH